MADNYPGTNIPIPRISENQKTAFVPAIATSLATLGCITYYGYKKGNTFIYFLGGLAAGYVVGGVVNAVVTNILDSSNPQGSR